MLGCESKSEASGEEPLECEGGGQLREVGEEVEEANGETDIQVKYYLEFRKIYFTAFKLAAEIRKQAKLKDSLAARTAHIEVHALHI